ncbi:SDR family NAD(P)-dependent oxidoreductase [Belnapia rosea]|uniref:SDR family NAD(P)-dependent oxidoreductase n=1 Tax=Belnapia rosea TaxID=938405 RepID=UPI00088F12B9|nr:SDR family oxidoreductase [Belnapia rosea]SDB22186.1 NAD(P)-dependent dehydrogenase, short-chain alcohol dehydrogenase family [Belnapia rosea]
MTTSNKPVVLVTGGSSGIGLAIARRFAELGMQVVLVGRRQGALDAAAFSLGAAAVGLAADVTSPADLERLFVEVKARFGRLDVLVPNAGGGQHAPLGQITEAQFDQQFATNVKGVVFTVQTALPLMKPGASIVIVGSTASIDPGPTMSIYGATKAAVRNLVRSWVSDLKGSGIRINIVSPGPTNTASLREAFGEHAEEGLAFLTDKSPIGRIGEPEEIAAVAAFLASDAASYVNGVELFADGGASQA